MQTLSRAVNGKRPIASELRKRQAYAAVFGGRGSKEDAEIVVSDLARVTGYYGVTEPGDPADVVKFSEGRRYVFSYLLSALRMTDAEIVALEEAARLEAIHVNQG